MRVLIVEDGFEYSQAFQRFLPQITWVRAGNGAEALAKLGAEPFDAMFSDMKFDRIPDDQLLGDLSRVADQFNGDADQARRHLQEHQGTYVLAAVRDAGHRLPVLMSHDFESEPRRWEKLVKKHAPVDHVGSDGSPGEVEKKLRALIA